MSTSSERIRTANDNLRRSHADGTIMITEGIQSLDAEVIQRIDQAVSTFDDFSSDDDPYGEHDFGALTVDGKRVYFKIDYFTPDLRYASPDPADVNLTRRVMTIMLASEY